MGIVRRMPKLYRAEVYQAAVRLLKELEADLTFDTGRDQAIADGEITERAQDDGDIVPPPYSGPIPMTIPPYPGPEGSPSHVCIIDTESSLKEIVSMGELTTRLSACDIDTRNTTLATLRLGMAITMRDVTYAPYSAIEASGKEPWLRDSESELTPALANVTDH